MNKRTLFSFLSVLLFTFLGPVKAQDQNNEWRQYADIIAQAKHKILLEISLDTNLQSNREASSEYYRTRLFELQKDFDFPDAPLDALVYKTSAMRGSLKSGNGMTEVDAGDRAALEALYNQCNGPNWTRKANWMTGPVETWEGVSVEGTRVVGMDLNNNGLTGILPDDLSNLTEIRTLKLNNNQLTGPLPASWGALVKLESINLDFNQISGSLPAEWSSMVNLKSCSIRDNKLTGPLPESWSALVNLQGILLRRNQINGTLPEAWSALVNLQQVSIWGNQLTGSLPSSWSSLVNLTMLYLQSNQFTGFLPEEWSAMTSLQILYLDNNQLTGGLPESWSLLSNLQTLNLPINNLSGSLPLSWSTMPQLSNLNLSGNQFNGNLPGSWSSMPNLLMLYIDNNQLSGPLPLEWSSFNNLAILDLSYNQISGSLPESWSTWSSLQQLYLYFNQLSGALPGSWSTMNLQWVGLNGNQFSGLLPENWANFPNMYGISLGGNLLNGSLPESWSALSKLNYINISNNQFNGGIPESWLALTNMEQCHFYGNQLTSLPVFSTWTNLKWLLVENNMLDFGDIEPNIGIPQIEFRYSPQAPVGTPADIQKASGEELSITVTVGGTSNIYQWFKNGASLPGANFPELVIPSVTVSDIGNYTCQITNSVATGLTLVSQAIRLSVIAKTPFCEDFNATGWNYNYTNGWSTNGAGGSGNSIGFFRGGSYGGNSKHGSTGYSAILYPFNNQTVYAITPGMVITGSSKYLTFYHGKRDYFHSGVDGTTALSADPRKVLISTDNKATWTEIYSTTMDQIPEVVVFSFLEELEPIAIPLTEYEGETVYFKFQAYRSGLNRGEWFIEDMCVMDLTPGAEIEVIGDGDFGNKFIPYSRQIVLTIKNNGLNRLRIKSAEIIDSQVFTIIEPSSYPIDVKGFLLESSEYPIVGSHNITVQFTPIEGLNYSGKLRITYGMEEDHFYDINLTGKGVTCHEAAMISELNCSEGPPAQCIKSFLGPQESLYEYTALYDQDISITSCDPHNLADYPHYAYDTYLMVFSGCPDDPNTIVHLQNDDLEEGCGYNRASSKGTIHLVEGQTIYIYWPLVFPTAEHAYDDFVFTLTVSPTPPWPDAEFYADRTVITAGETVNFFNNSTGNPTSWQWEFPGSTQGGSIEENPIGIIYPEPGNYYVKLTASNSYHTAELIKAGYIVVTETEGELNAEEISGGSEGFNVAGMKDAIIISPSGWMFGDHDGYGLNWEIRKTGIAGCNVTEGPMPSTTGNLGYLVLPADEYNCANNKSIVTDHFAQSPPFDCSEYDIVIYEFQQRYNVNGLLPQMELQVSNDGGYNWKPFDIRMGKSIFPVPVSEVEVVQANISEVAARQSDVRVRFYWKGSTGNFWMIDDIVVKGIKACNGLMASITGDQLVYRGYQPKSYTTLNVLAEGGQEPYDYQWSNGQTGSSITVSPIVTTEYSVDVTDAQGCAVSAAFTVNVKDVRCGDKMNKVLMCRPDNSKNKQPQTICVSPASVPDLLSQGATLGACKKLGIPGDGDLDDIIDPVLSIYPNPSNGRLNLILDGVADDNFKIIIRDVLGRAVYEEMHTQPIDHLEQVINLERSGSYFITVEGTSFKLTRQVSVIR